MPRRARHYIANQPYHIVQRGNNRQVCFNGDEDMAAYANWLKEFSVKFQVETYAWVFIFMKF